MITLGGMDKRALSERDICTKFITPALRQAGWDQMLQIHEEVGFTKGRITVRGKLVSRGQGKRADYSLSYKPNIRLALIEGKDNTHSLGDGMQQALDYAETLGIPFVFSSNGDGFLFHDRTGASNPREVDLGLDALPSPTELRREDLDPFDLVCHVAFDAKPLTRRERADNVRKRNVFNRYGEQARAVLDALLAKYADVGVLDLDDTNVLKIPPLTRSEPWSSSSRRSVARRSSRPPCTRCKPRGTRGSHENGPR